MNILKRTKHFINSANNKHNSKFNYDKINYINAFTKVTISCPIHGDFAIAPTSHLSSKYGCPQCGTESMARQQKQKTYDKFKQFSTHPDNHFDYSLTKFDKITDKITVICNKHGSFSLTLDHHLRGIGCKKCADENKQGGYTHKLFKNNPNIANLPGQLYVIRMFSESESFIKIGITKHSLEKRYKHSPYKFEAIKIIYDSIYNCFKLEEQLKKEFVKSKYKNKLKFHLTESYNIEILPNILKVILN